MNVQPDQAEDMVAGSWSDPANGTTFQINQTLWGYVLISDYAEKPMRTMFTMARKVIGTILVIATLSLWVFPGAGPETQIVGLKIGLTVLYGVLAFLFLYRPRQSVRREVQVDVNRAELRAGYRNDSGDFSLESLHGFDSVSVVSLCTGKGKQGNAGLLLRIADSDVAMMAARGPKAAMEECRIRLALDLGAATGKFNPIALASCEGPGPMVLGPRMEASPAAA